MKPNHVKRALMRGQGQVRTWGSTFSTPHITQVLASAGFDFINYDALWSRLSTVGVRPPTQ